VQGLFPSSQSPATLFEIVEVRTSGREDMDDDVARLDMDPVAPQFPLDAAHLAEGPASLSALRDCRRQPIHYCATARAMNHLVPPRLDFFPGCHETMFSALESSRLAGLVVRMQGTRGVVYRLIPPARHDSSLLPQCVL